MGHPSDNSQDQLYKLAGRQRNDRRTLGELGSLKTKTLEQAALDQDVQKNTHGFIKKFIMLGIVLFAITLGIYFIAKLYGASLTSGEHTSSTNLYHVMVGMDKLTLPANTIRFSSNRHSGIHDKIEMYMHWPSLSGYTTQLSDQYNTPNNSDNLIFLTLEQRNMMLDMSGRITHIYKKYFDGEGKMQPFGLMQQGLSAEGGYIDEDLFYAIDSPYPFVTRCIKDSQTVVRPICIRDVQIGKSMMLTYRFHKKLLPQWIELDQAIRAHIKSMITNL